MKGEGMCLPLSVSKEAREERKPVSGNKRQNKNQILYTSPPAGGPGGKEEANSNSHTHTLKHKLHTSLFCAETTSQETQL